MISEDLRQDFRNFQNHHLGQMGRPLPDEMWHYTDGNGLIGILKSGSLYFTHIACLNDSLEYRYFGDLVLEEVKKRHGVNTDRKLEPFWVTALELLTSQRSYANVGHFVACLSEVQDDLGQWRGYGGGECGYAICFRPTGLSEAITHRRPSTLILPLNYNPLNHALIVDDIVNYAVKQFLSVPAADPKAWTTELLIALAQETPLLSALVKHPKFAPEQERRLSTDLLVGEFESLVFRQKRTLLSRSLPINLSLPSGKLPITKIMVGPGPAQEIPGLASMTSWRNMAIRMFR